MKRIFFINFFIFFLLLSLTSFAQLDRANKFYENKEYSKAINLYLSVLQKEESTEALEKIADSYRLMRDYAQAEPYYERLMKRNDVNAINHFHYGNVLKGNNKQDEAKAEDQSCDKRHENLHDCLLKQANDER